MNNNTILHAIANEPVGTTFKCGDFVISRKRAYTDSTGDRMLVFLSGMYD